MLDVHVALKDVSGDIINSFSFDDVEMETNMQTIYSGACFQMGQSVNTTINNEWKENNYVTF